MTPFQSFGLLVMDYAPVETEFFTNSQRLKQWRLMALTALPLRLLHGDNGYILQSNAVRMLILGLVLMAFTLVTGCSSSDGGDQSNLLNSNGGGVPTGGASVSLAWDPVPNVLGYIVHYGIASPNSSGSCAYPSSMFTSTPSVTVDGLAENRTYYFAVSAFNGLESPCSGEVVTVTNSI